MYNWNSGYGFYGKSNNKLSNGMTKSGFNIIQHPNINAMPNSNNIQQVPTNSEKSNNVHSTKPNSPIDNKKSNSNLAINNETILFEIFGIKIYFDDILILCILLFLYQENIHDEYLFISLILLLLS